MNEDKEETPKLQHPSAPPDPWHFHSFHKPEIRRLSDASEALLEAYRAAGEGDDDD